MTALQAHQPRLPAARPAAGQIAIGAEQAKAVVRKIDTEFLELRRHKARLWREHPKYISAVYELRDLLSSLRRHREHPSGRELDVNAVRERLLGFIRRLPSRSDLEMTCRLSKAAIETKPKRDHLGLCIGRLVDSFPNARAHQPDMYRENLVHLAGRDGHSAQVVAEACDDLMRAEGQTFLPAPSEFLEACSKAAKSIEMGWRVDWKALDALIGAEHELAALPPADDVATFLAPADVDESLAPPPEPQRSAFV